MSIPSSSRAGGDEKRASDTEVARILGHSQRLLLLKVAKNTRTQQQFCSRNGRALAYLFVDAGDVDEPRLVRAFLDRDAQGLRHVGDDLLVLLYLPWSTFVDTQQKKIACDPAVSWADRHVLQTVPENEGMIDQVHKVR